MNGLNTFYVKLTYNIQGFPCQMILWTILEKYCNLHITLYTSILDSVYKLKKKNVLLKYC